MAGLATLPLNYERYSFSHRTKMGTNYRGANFQLACNNEGNAADIAAKIDAVNVCDVKVQVSKIIKLENKTAVNNLSDAAGLYFNLQSSGNPGKKLQVALPLVKSSITEAEFNAIKDAYLDAGIYFQDAKERAILGDASLWYLADTYAAYTRGTPRDLSKADTTSISGT